LLTESPKANALNPAFHQKTSCGHGLVFSGHVVKIRRKA
jgi:hypothetical protein